MAEEKTTTDMEVEPKAPEPPADSYIDIGTKVNATDMNELFEALEAIRQKQYSRNDVTNTIISSAFTTSVAAIGNKATPAPLTQAQTYINNLETAVANIGTTDFSAKITIPTAGQLLNAASYQAAENTIAAINNICVNCSDFTAHFTSAASRGNFSANFTANFTAHFTSAANRSNFTNFTSAANRSNFSNFTSSASRGNFGDFNDCSYFSSSSQRSNFGSNFSTNANNGNFTGSQSAGLTVFRSSGGWVQS